MIKVIIAMELRIGILECDHAIPELRDEHGDYSDMFADLVSAEHTAIEYSLYDLTADQFPVDISACDAYIVTGSKIGVYEDLPWINKAKDLVRKLYDNKIPTIGICFGHQLIAESLGGKVVKADDKGRGLGVQTWDIKSKPEWMGDFLSASLSLNACHQDQIIELPGNSELIAGSDFCPIAGFQIGTMLGIQGHPEFNKEYTKYLFDKYEDTLDLETKNITLDSFEKTADSKIVGAWMLDFIQSRLKSV